MSLDKIVGEIKLVSSLGSTISNDNVKKTEEIEENYVSTSEMLLGNKDFKDEFDKFNKTIGNSLMILSEPQNPFIGREGEMRTLAKVMDFKKEPVAILLAEAGMGKTTLVREFAKLANNRKIKGIDRKYVVLDLQLGLMSSIGKDEFQAALQRLLGDVRKLQTLARELLDDQKIHFILFIDEIHTVISIFGDGTKIGGDLLKYSLTPAQVCVVGATTRKEYDRSIALDDPLKERFTPIEFKAFSKEQLKEIIKAWWIDLDGDEIGPLSDHLIDKILEYGQRHKEEASEPRRSIKVIQALESWCRIDKEPPSLRVIGEIFESLYGVQTSVSFNTEEVIDTLNKELLGQHMAKFQLFDFFKRFKIRVGQRGSKPLGSFMFIGPTGVGKTESARIINRTLYSGEAHMEFINIPDYAMLEDGDLALRRDVGEAARHHPQTIFLFDEVEKGILSKKNNKIKVNLLPTFLSLMDNGKVKYDALNREKQRETYTVSLQNTILIFTSNAGYKAFENDEKRGDNNFDETRDTKESRSKRKNLESNVKERLLSEGFSPEYLGRLDKFVLFRRLSEYAGILIADRILRRYFSDLEMEQGIEILVNEPNLIRKEEVTGAPSDFEAQELSVFIGKVKSDMMDSSKGGARQVKTVLEEEIEELIANAYYENKGKKRFKLSVANRGLLPQEKDVEEVEIKIECLE